MAQKEVRRPARKNASGGLIKKKTVLNWGSGKDSA